MGRKISRVYNRERNANASLSSENEAVLSWLIDYKAERKQVKEMKFFHGSMSQRIFSSTGSSRLWVVLNRKPVRMYIAEQE